MNKHEQVAILFSFFAATVVLGGCVGDEHPPGDEALEMQAEPEPAIKVKATGDSWVTWISVHRPNGTIGPKVLEIRSPTWANGSRAEIWDHIPGSEYELWAMVDTGEYLGDRTYELINISSGACLDMKSDGAVGNGTDVQQWDCSEAANQSWIATRVSTDAFSKWVELRNRQNPSLCLDVEDVNYSNGALLQVWTCAGNWNQRWNIYP